MGDVIFFDLHKKTRGGYMLSAERRKEIEDITIKILKESGMSDSNQIDISTIVKNDGFSIETQDMPVETTGLLFVDDNSTKKTIIVNTVFSNPYDEEDVIFKKSRFITAHEYGHFILHKPKNKPLYAHRDSDKRDEPKELEADYFARCLLMPKKRFLDEFEIWYDMSDKDKDFTIFALSKIFRVTKNKVYTRIEDMYLELD